ncbi:hypothetical protein CWI38_0134p0010 [Hamiltosporidium tvaerminnensis]|uniref:Uncharacterized protein n=2 Tax=Hamiltosporidium TaxID=1176354 RepID=A0A4Q9KX57_9MICR|nr:hypothetical protein CWI36_2052p0030 [Hamiltosporidium magnivora]TBU20086.1 hypothetical protein CWI38_0134p0010 [Hamiltosporidium tvaerminnensis]
MLFKRYKKRLQNKKEEPKLKKIKNPIQTTNFTKIQRIQHLLSSNSNDMKNIAFNSILLLPEDYFKTYLVILTPQILMNTVVLTQSRSNLSNFLVFKKLVTKIVNSSLFPSVHEKFSNYIKILPFQQSKVLEDIYQSRKNYSLKISPINFNARIFLKNKNLLKISN